MPIKSYLAHPYDGQKENLVLTLRRLKQCKVLPAENKDVLALVTETSTEEEEEELIKKINTIKSLRFLSMVAGFELPPTLQNE